MTNKKTASEIVDGILPLLGHVLTAQLTSIFDEIETLVKSQETNDEIETLKVFYGVSAQPELISAMCKHIEKLQTKLLLKPLYTHPQQARQDGMVLVPEGFEVVVRPSDDSIIVTRLSDGWVAIYEKDSPLGANMMAYRFISAILTATQRESAAKEQGE